MWRPRALAREAWENLGPRQVVHGALSVLVVTGIGLLYASSATSALAQEADRRAAGSLVVQAIADPETSLSGHTCDRLNASDGVAAAGGIAAQRPVAPIAFPGGPPVPVEALTPRAIAVWAPGTWAGVAVGSDLLDTGAIAVGSTLTSLDGARVPVADVLPSGVPLTRLRSAVLIPVPPNTELSECWLRMAPGHLDDGLRLAEYAFADAQVRIIPFAEMPPDLLTPSQQWHSFARGQPWLAGSAILAAVSALLAWTRRAEFAVYRAFGTTRWVIAMMSLMESALVLVPALLLSCLLTVFGAWAMADGVLDPGLARLLAAVQGATVLTALGLSAVTVQLGLLGRVTDALKDR